MLYELVKGALRRNLWFDVRCEDEAYFVLQGAALEGQEYYEHYGQGAAEALGRCSFGNHCGGEAPT